MPLSDDELRHRVEVYNRHGRNISAAAREIGVNRVALKKNLFSAARRGLSGTGASESPSAPLDVVERHRLASEITRLRGICQNLTERVAAAEDHRTSILGLDIAPAEPTP